MADKIIKYFVKRHLLANFIFLGVILAGLFYWGAMKKEAMPNVSFDRINVSASYPGASPEQVEYYVTKEIEDRLSGIDGIESISSASSFGSSRISVNLEHGRDDRNDIINEIRTAVADARLPSDVIDEPRIKEFRSTKRPIIDIGFYIDGVHLLNDVQRRLLQSYVLSLEDRLLNLKELSESYRRSYIDPEIRIEAIPEKMKKYNISFSKIASAIRANNALYPAGILEDKRESRVTISSGLNTAEKLKEVIIQGGFEGQKIYLGDVARIKESFRKTDDIRKINGHEGVILNMVKTGEAGILEAVKKLKKEVNSFRENNLKGTAIKMVLLDDESYDVRNRLSIVASNGSIGLILVIAILLIFLNVRTAAWVALGIPFTFCTTILVSYMLGYTVNNITLAAVIIVMGIVVDDAIIVAENISRTRSLGGGFEKSAVTGTAYVLLPITAAVITTCVAFTPLLYFSGKMGEMVKHTTPIIYIMLFASLFESLFILPSHMTLHAPKWLKKLKDNTGSASGKAGKKTQKEQRVRHWFLAIEDKYGGILEKAIKHKYIVFITAFALLVISLLLAVFVMKFSMFPREESRFSFISGTAPGNYTLKDTAEIVRGLEKIIASYMGKEVVGFRTSMGINRRGRTAGENSFRIWIELVSREDRKKSLKQLTSEWEKKMEPLKKIFTKLSFAGHRWGSDSGSPIEIKVKSNNDKQRNGAADKLAAAMGQIKDIDNPEVDKPRTNPEYLIRLNREEGTKLGVSPESIRTTLRSVLEGTILYEIKGEDEEIRVRLTTADYDKSHLNNVLKIPVENRGNYLVPLKNLIKVEKTKAPDSIEREDFKRITRVYADFGENTKKTPLEIAAYLEENVFPSITAEYPAIALSFGGEIEDSMESGKDFRNAIITVLLIIYLILALLFNSMGKPFIIMLTIPFGIVGIIAALLAHGQLIYGFFSIVGALGLIGVVVNDSIVMLVKLNRELKERHHCALKDREIADIAKSRLQAVTLTTLTTVLAVLPTAYGWLGYDSMLGEMMMALAYGLLFGTIITLILVPCGYAAERDLKRVIDSKLCGINRVKK